MLTHNFTKIFYCLMLGVAPLFASTPIDMVKILSTSDSEIVLSIKPSADITTFSEKGNSFTQISAPSEGMLAQDGMPDLPVITRLLTFPTDGELHIEVIQDETVEINLSSPIASFSVDDNSILSADYNLESERVFPANIVELGERQLYRGHRLYPFKIIPYQYDHKNQTLIHHEELTVSIRFEASTEPVADNLRPNAPAPLTFDSYRFLNAITMNGPQRDDDGAGLPRGGYLIATHLSENAVGEHAERLADWKRACGHQVEIMYGYNNLRGAATQFRNNEIQPRYEEWDPPLEFACVISTFTEGDRNTDVTYGCLDGNNDHVPEVAIARLGAASNRDAENVINRALSYQRDPWTEELGWFNRAGAYAQNVGRSHTPAVDYTASWIAAAESRAGFPDVEMNNTLNDGSGYPSNWLRDGLSVIFERGLTRNPSFDNLDFHTMWISSGGGHVPPAVDQVWNPGRQRGPSVMTGTGHNPQTIHCNVVLGGMARGLVIEKLPLGWARALSMLMLDYSNVDGWTQFSSEFRIMGEPGQRAWIGVPQMIEVSHTEFIVTGQNYFETVVVDERNGEGVSGALVTLIQPGELLTYGTTNEDGRCVLYLSENLDNDMTLTVTKEAVLPYQTEIEVRESHLFVRGFISEMDDEENGNGNGVLNPGETVNIFITAENLSEDEDSEGVTGMLISNSGWLVVNAEEFNIGNVEHSEEVQYEEGLSITLDPSAPEDANLSLSLILSSGEFNWISSLELEVEGANLNFEEVVGGTTFEPEMTDLNISLINDGSLRSQPMAAELVSVGQWIQIIRSDAVFPAVNSGQERRLSGEPFSINPSPLASPGTIAPMIVLLRANENDIPDTIRFDLQIDEPRETGPNGPDAYGYICFDDTDDNWDQAPEYNWIEIDPSNGDRDFDGEEVPGRREEEFTAEVELPFDFQYYGETYTHISVSENGFMSMGEGLEVLKQYDNFPLDRMINGSVGMIAPYWDNLNIRANDANIFTYYDSEENIYIVQWERIGFISGNNRVTFEVILYDPEVYPTLSGDGNILVQYKAVPNPVRGVDPQYFSAGICSPDGSTGINYAYGNDYPVPSAEIANQRALYYTTSPEAPRGEIFGRVLDVATNEPMEEVAVVTSWGQVAFTNEEGNYRIPDAWGLTFDVTVIKQGWNDSTLTGFDLEEGDEIEVNFAMLHPDFVPTSWDLSYTLDPDHQTELEFSVHNTGNGPLDWEVDRRLFGNANAEPWEFREDYGFGGQLDDNGIYGVAYINNQFYVSGSNKFAEEEGGIPIAHPTIYIMDSDGARIDTFSQPGGGRYGMKDMTYDGNLIWGAVDNFVYGLTLEGEVITSFRAPYNSPSTPITWDSDREVLWIASTTNNPKGYDRDGNFVDGMEIDSDRMRVYGLAYFPDDPDDSPLYIYHKEPETDNRTVHKYNFETEEIIFVTYLDHEDGGTPQGSFITNTYDVYSWVFMSVANLAPGQGGDRVDFHQIEGRKEWFKVDLVAEEGRIEATSGQLQTDDIMDFILTLDATALPETLFQSELYFTHNADSGIGHINIDLQVIGEVGPSAFGLAMPANGDTTRTAAVDFSWEPSYDLNADDHVSYRFWTSQGLNERSFALMDTSITIDVDSLWNEIDYSQPVDWWVEARGGDDVIECNQRFNFILDINALGDDEPQIPFVFNINSLYPNPFNGMTTIAFEIPKITPTWLTVIDLLGREAAVLHQGVLEAGRYNTIWDAQSFSSGVYLIKLETADNRMIRKTLLLK